MMLYNMMFSTFYNDEILVNDYKDHFVLFHYSKY